MNFLAHIYLSGDHPEIQIGNFIADAVKGKAYLNFAPGIQQGILLHRAIDSFTDTHPIFRRSTARLHNKQYGHYCGVIVDLFYDHFLAHNWALYHDQNPEDYVQNFYDLLETNSSKLPQRIQSLKPYMIEQNWLLKYADFEGISTILAQMNRRTKGQSHMDQAPADLKEHYPDFENDFTQFFEEIRTFTRAQLNAL